MVALWSLAVAQPLYDLLARNPEFFAVRGTTLGDAVLFAITLSLVAPAVLVGVTFLVSLLVKKGWRLLHLVVVVLLVAILVINPAKALSWHATWLVAGSLLVGGVVAWALRRWTAARRWIELLAISAVVFPVIFFWRAPAATWSGSGEVATVQVPPPTDPVPIVFVVFDELPLAALLGEDGTIDAESFPNFAALVEQATWYPLATTVSDFTTLAIPAMLTGRIARQHEQPTVADHPDNLFTLLAPHYQIVAHESVTRLCPATVCGREREPLMQRMRALYHDLGLAWLHIVLPATWATKLPSVDQTWRDFGRGEERADTWREQDRRWINLFEEKARGDRAAELQRFLSRVEGGDAPVLYFYASFLPHTPFHYLPSGRLYSVAGDPAGMVKPALWGNDAWAVLQDHQRYLLQLGFVDRQLGVLLRRLRAVGLYDEALLVVTADHGMTFRRNGARRGLNKQDFAETLAVPLFLKWPDQRGGRRDDRPVELIDLLPTILDTLGIELPMEGRSLLAPARDERWHRVAPKYAKPGTILRFSSRELRRGVSAAVDRKLQHFGAEGFSKRFYQIGEFKDLVGRRVPALDTLPVSSLAVDFSLPTADAHFDPEQDYVPAHIVGSVELARGDEPQNLAIAVNGTIEAVTRTWDESPQHPRGAWSAVIDEKAFVPGDNTVEVLHVQSTAKGVQLARIDGGGHAPRSRRDLLGVEQILGVEESGFHGTERSPEGERFRWTDGHARLEIPLEGSSDPRAIRIGLFWTGPRGTELHILLDGRQVFADRVPSGSWHREFPLPRRSRGERLVVEIVSDTFVPARSTKGFQSTRRLGVAVEEIRLLRQ